MGYQVALSPSARRDLRDIVRYISTDSPARAVTFGQFLVSSTKRLAEFPELGRVVPEFATPTIREIVVHSYRVIYESVLREVLPNLCRYPLSEIFVEIGHFQGNLDKVFGNDSRKNLGRV